MLINCYLFLTILLLCVIREQAVAKKRQRRYLLFPKSTQWGVFGTVSVPLPHEAYVSVAWFFEANYYNVANATYFEPLLGDGAEAGTRVRRDDTNDGPQEIVTRSSIYTLIESMLEKHGYPGQPCLLRLICENAHAHFLHNGLIGDILYLILTPSASIAEDTLDDSYYEAEYCGLHQDCRCYAQECPVNPLESISLYADSIL